MISTASLLLGALLAQNPQEGVTLSGLPSTVRLGSVVRAALKIETRRQPEIPKLPTVDGVRLALGRPSSNRSMVYVNGRMTVSNSWTFPFDVTPQRFGKFTIPPITVKIGSKVYSTKKRVLDVVKDVTGKSFGGLTVRPSRTRVYVHEPVRFAVECAVDDQLDLASGMAQNGVRYHSVFLEAEWLGKDVEDAELIDEPDTDTDKTTTIVLNQTLQVADVSNERFADGKSRHVFRYHKAILPVRAGKRTLMAPILKFTVVRGASRDPFSVFSSRGRKEYILYGKPIELEVLPLPAEGRPNPFYGGVGRFTVRAEIDRQTVKVGSSVKLILTIAGQGNTEHLQVPELEDIPGFHRLGNIVNRSPDKVVVTYDLTPRTAEVAELPAIAWNFFDTTPGLEKYVELETDPLPITVRRLVGEESLPALPGAKGKPVSPGVDDIFDLKLAHGGVPTDLPARPGTGTALVVGLLPWLVCVLGMFLWRTRRRVMADVSGRRARGAWRRFQKSQDDGVAPLDALVDYVADRLGCEPAAVIGPDLTERLTAAGVEPAKARAVHDLVDEGVAARYGGGGGVDRDRVSVMVRSLEQTKAVAPVGLVLMCILCGASRAQAQELSTAEQSYRDGDYAAAAEGFRAAAAAGDRRAAYNLGNSLFRRGRYANALAAYEKARLAMPRDPEVLANIRLCRERLDLGSAEGEAFAQTLASIRDSFTASELFWLCALCNALAAGLICFGGRRLRIAGGIAVVPAVVLIVEVGFLGPARPPAGIIVSPSAELRAEPNEALTPLMKLRGGVTVEVLGSTSAWMLVRSAGRRGYLPASSLVVID